MTICCPHDYPPGSYYCIRCGEARTGQTTRLEPDNADDDDSTLIEYAAELAERVRLAAEEWT